MGQREFLAQEESGNDGGDYDGDVDQGGRVRRIQEHDGKVDREDVERAEEAPEGEELQLTARAQYLEVVVFANDGHDDEGDQVADQGMVAGRQVYAAFHDYVGAGESQRRQDCERGAFVLSDFGLDWGFDLFRAGI